MFHGCLDEPAARGLAHLRKRIDRAGIPSSRLDETLILATWNIREFGNKPRTDRAIHYIAEILGQFDVIAITELRDDLRDLERVVRILGPYWRVVFSDYNVDDAGNRERIGYLYDKRAATFTGFAAEADPPRVRNENGRYVAAFDWWRSPFMASFRAGNFDFILFTAHIRWGSGVRERLVPIRALADWVALRAAEPHVVDGDFIVLGDFNIPSTGSSLYRAVTSRGLTIPPALLDIRNAELTTNLSRNKRYDQILHYSEKTFSATGAAGVLDFYAGDWAPLFPQAEFPELSQYDLTFELSDHLPLWLELRLRVDEEKLDQILNR